MTQPDMGALRAAMIDNQLRPTGVSDPRVLAAFAGVAREAFVPARLKTFAYLDEDLEIAPGRFLMEPLVFGNLLMRAELRGDDRVLLIGAASGYEAAVAGRLAYEVVAVEEDAALAAAAREALASTFSANVRIFEGPLAAGAPDAAPFDVLFLNGRVAEVPPVLVDQLRDGGRAVAAIADARGVGRGMAGRKEAGVIGWQAFMDVNIGALPGFGRARTFQFEGA